MKSENSNGKKNLKPFLVGGFLGIQDEAESETLNAAQSDGFLSIFSHK